MQYLLTQNEMDNLVPLEEIHKRDEALEAARKIIVSLTKVQCGIHDCSYCPISCIGYYEEDDPNKITIQNSKLICIEDRKYHK